MPPRPKPDARVKHLRSHGYHDGAVQRAVATELVAKGRELSTADAVAVYGLQAFYTKGQYRNVRRALQRIADPIGRSKDKPGQPTIWKAKPLGGAGKGQRQ